MKENNFSYCWFSPRTLASEGVGEKWERPPGITSGVLEQFQVLHKFYVLHHYINSKQSFRFFLFIMVQDSRL